MLVPLPGACQHDLLRETFIPKPIVSKTPIPSRVLGVKGKARAQAAEYCHIMMARQESTHALRTSSSKRGIVPTSQTQVTKP